MTNLLDDYIPRELPCGEEINQNYQPGMELESCKTCCPKKTNKEIEKCYDSYKYE